MAEAQAYLAEEPIDPAMLAALAEMLAAMANGPLHRKDKRTWKAADFMPDRWQPEKQQEEQPSPMQFMAGFKARRKG